jgi:cation/acetate symporter
MAGFSPRRLHCGSSKAANAAFKKQLNKVYAWYTGGFLTFIIILAILEQMGLPREYIGLTFLAATVLLYAGIGFMSRTSDASEYYVAGGAFPPSTTAWPPAPTGCRPPASSAWPARCT